MFAEKIRQLGHGSKACPDLGRLRLPFDFGNRAVGAVFAHAPVRGLRTGVCDEDRSLIGHRVLVEPFDYLDSVVLVYEVVE